MRSIILFGTIASFMAIQFLEGCDREDVRDLVTLRPQIKCVVII